ncbi:DMT family transporter [Primorskyibacter flagellatus]|uniref:Uncharacterized membrane protein n=1 Tax=Primorskyibacter flagellatus TaxID=1387277 RepID=A0A1W2BXT3_9RHOB|nr:DMT family transporter [Primorskyibacter flagellatus]SMC77787.1 Uncharacterized membrane protein [Primorskyibacter flagellatus]
MRDKPAMTAIVLMLFVAIISATDAVIVRLLAGEIHPFVIGFTRAGFGLLAMLPWMMKRPHILKTKRYGLHALRAGLKLLSLVALFAALAGAPLASVTAIGFAAPVFVTVGAWFLLAEQPRPLRIFSAALGFVGVVVILKPAMVGGATATALWLALLSALLVATIQLILKVMGRTEGAETLVAWNLITMVPLAVLPAIYFWTTPTLLQWGLLALQGSLGAINQVAVTRAFQLGEASLVAPMDFLRLPLVAALAYMLFGEVAGLATWVGASLIFVSIALMASTARSKLSPE